MADSTSYTLMLYVRSSISTKTGIALFCKTGFKVVGKVTATVITLSPVFILLILKLSEAKDEKATRLAQEPELTGKVEFTSSYFET